MKSQSFKNGQFGLLISLSFLITACNPEEYFPTQELIEGADAYCAEAKDVPSCQALPGCQPAYNDMPDETVEPTFAACVVNPDYLPPSDGSTAGSTDGSSDGSTTGGTTGDGTTDGSGDGSTTGGTTGGTTGDGSTDGSGDGSTTGGTTGGTTGDGSTDGSDDQPVTVPTLDEAWKAKCENLADEYMYVKKLINKKTGTKIISKVKVCHSTGDGSAHTIIIACPALKAHAKHHSGNDYLGACAQ